MAENATEVIEFVPKKCPTCEELLSCRKLGCWGYFCTRCLMWWGTYDPYPIVKTVEGAEPEPAPATEAEEAVPKE